MARGIKKNFTGLKIKVDETKEMGTIVKQDIPAGEHNLLHFEVKMENGETRLYHRRDITIPRNQG